MTLITASTSAISSASSTATIAPVSIGLLGLGTVGSGVYKILSNLPTLVIQRVVVQNPDKQRAVDLSANTTLSQNIDDVLSDPNIQLVIEVMGGLEQPYEAIKKALQAGKHVVTANKMVIATYGPELFALAAQNQVNLLFEAAVAGGIPIVLPLKTSLAGNHIEQIAGILNGTTNYILTRMEQAGLEFDAALKEAQEKGFAEADPTADVEGYDAACKIGILASIAYGKHVNKDAIYTEGISKITAVDIKMAADLGFAIRLVAQAQAPTAQAVDLRVHPMLVPLTHPLASILFENNAIWIKGDAVGDVMFYGKGAGEMPTASSVVGDVLLITRALQSQALLSGFDFQTDQSATLIPISETSHSYYIRLETEDVPGVIGHLGRACGDHNVSLAALLQKGVDIEKGSATIVLVTHTVQESNLQAALQTIQNQSTTRHVHCMLRVFTP